MDRLIYTAMSGAKQTFLQQAGVAQNLANVATIGYRAMENRFRAVPVLGACLLYTSPSPRDRTRSRMPSSA